MHRSGIIILTGLLLVTGIQAQSAPEEIRGMIDNTNPFVEVPFSLNQDARVTLDLRATSGDLDTLLYVVDASGNIILENDDRTRGDTSSRVGDLSLSAGTYTAIATRYGVDEGDTSGNFELNLSYDRQTTPIETFDLSETALEDQGFPQVAPLARAPYAIYAYLGGDTSLEEAILNDLNELEKSGGTDETVRVLALVDRSPRYTEIDGNWKSTRLYEVTASTGSGISSRLLADFGARDTGKAELLAQFLVWAAGHYPAEQTLVTLSGHGGGWSGLIVDESADSVISLPQLDAALASATAAAGVEKFDLLINEACLMSSIEYFTVVSKYFHQTIASPEIVVEPSLDLSDLASSLHESGDFDAIGRKVIDRYISTASQIPSISSDYLSYAIVNLDEFDPVVAGVDAFARIVNSDPIRYSPVLGAAYTNAYKLGSFAGGLDKLDLGHFMQQVIATTDDPALVKAASNLLEALTVARVYGDAASVASLYTSYYNIYFPAAAASLNPRYFRDTPLTAWGQMLVNYFATLSPRLWSVEDSLAAYHPPQRPQVKIRSVLPTVATPDLPPTLGLEIVGRSISTGEFVVDRVLPDGRRVRRLSVAILTQVQLPERTETVNTWKSGLDLSYFTWSPFTVPVLTDGTHTNEELVIRTRDQATLRGRYTTGSEDDWQEVVVLFAADGSVARAMAPTPFGTWADITLPADTRFQAYTSVVQADGATKYVAGNEYRWGGLRTFDRTPVSGDYDLGFLIRTRAGTTGFASTPMTIATSGDAITDTYVDSQLGFTVSTPRGWTRSTVEGRLTFSTAGTELAIMTQPQADDSPYTALSNYLATSDQTLAQSADLTTINGLSVLRFLTTDSVRGIAFVRTTDAGISGGVLAVTGDEVAASAVIASVRPFALASFAVGSADEWHYETIANGVSLPVPLGWTAQRTPANDLIYAPAGGDGLTRLVIRLLPDQTPDEALAQLQQMTVVPVANTTNRTYFGEYHAWQTVAYTASTPQATVGRAYATRLNGQTYLFDMQTPTSADDYHVFREVFEPMVDGFAPPLTVSLATSDIQPSRIKAALIAAADACGTVPANSYCVGQGVISVETQTFALLPRFAKPALTLATPALIQGESQSLTHVDRLDVGLQSDGTIDSSSVSVLNINGVEIVAMGGVTMVNRSAPIAGQVESLRLTNIARERLNVRALPAVNSAIIHQLEVGASVEAVGRSADNSWLRVRVDALSGWVSASLLSDDAQRSSLPISDPAQPYYATMQAMDVFVSDNLNDLALTQAIIISVPDSAREPRRLSINDTELEIAPGTVLLWHVEDTAGEIVDFNSEGVVGLYARRRPATFTSEVLRGVVRVVRADSVVTAIAGTAVRVEGREAVVRTQSTTIQRLAQNTLTAIATDARPLPPLNSTQVRELIKEQSTLNETPLNDLDDLANTGNTTQTDSLSSTLSTLTAPTATATSAALVTPLAIGNNWCDPGQPWGDGRCDDPDPSRRAWFYQMGFYQYQVANGASLNTIPPQYRGFLAESAPPKPTPTPTLPPLATPILESTPLTPMARYIAFETVNCTVPSEHLTLTGTFFRPDTATISTMNNVFPMGGPQLALQAWSGTTITLDLDCPQVNPDSPIPFMVGVNDSQGRTTTYQAEPVYGY